MIRRNKNEMQISEAELRSMTAAMVEMHEDTFPEMRASLTDAGASLRERGSAIAGSVASRRGFLAGGGAVAGGLLLSACGSDSKTADKGSSGGTTGGTTGGGDKGGDKSALATNASLENLAVFAYGSALMDAGKGKFGKTVPAAVAEFAKHAMKQHQDHADAFNAALKAAGGTEFTKPDPALAAAVIKLYGAVNSVPALAKLALTLENTAAATYTKQMGELTNPAALSAVATIAPVERQHAAILSFVLGEYPVPDTFVKLDMARPDSDAGVK